MKVDDPYGAPQGDDAPRVAERAGDLRRAILQNCDEQRPATVGEVAAALALVERLAALVPTSED